jgi:soluble lytic murein transglycosylase
VSRPVAEGRSGGGDGRAGGDCGYSRTQRGRRRRGRRRGFIRLAVLGFVVVALGIVVGLVATGRTVIPGLSDKVYPIQYREEIARAADKYDVDPYLLAAVAKTESGFDPTAVSPVGAIGLMQLMPDTADWVTGLTSWKGDADPELTDPGDSLELGACYLSYLGKTLEGGTRPALAAYNAGQGTVRGWIEAAGGVASFGLSDIVFPETRAFVERVEHYWNLYSHIYSDMFAGAGDAGEVRS